jgi:hypothetical protein
LKQLIRRDPRVKIRVPRVDEDECSAVKPIEAVRTAKSYLQEILADEAVVNIGLEELEYEDEANVWRAPSASPARGTRRKRARRHPCGRMTDRPRPPC